MMLGINGTGLTGLNDGVLVSSYSGSCGGGTANVTDQKVQAKRDTNHSKSRTHTICTWLMTLPL